MECAFGGSGYEQVLTDATYDVQKKQMNILLYSQLSVATVWGTANKLIKQHEGNKNGYVSWNNLREWYYGYAVNNET